MFYASRIEHLDDPHRHVLLTKEDILKFNPNTQTLVLVRTDKDLEILRKLYNATTIFKRIGENRIVDPWNFRTLRMFDMANDSGLFRTSPDALSDPAPLYEGKMFHQFDERWATFDNPLRPNEPRDVTLLEKEDPVFKCTPRYWISQAEVYDRFKNKDGDCWWNKPWMLGLRSITSPTNQRTLICSLLPSSFGAGHSINLLFPKKSESEVACLLANLNSLVVDFVQRIKQSGMNANLFLIFQLPILTPSLYEEKIKKYIVDRVAKLTRNSNSIREVWLKNYEGYEFQEPLERIKLRAELDACIARLYKLNREDLAYLLDPKGEMGENYPSVTFPSLKEEEISKYGEFLTKRLVLEAFDKLENMEVAGDA